MRYDAIEEIENSISDTSNMYNLWTTNLNFSSGTHSYKITLPAVPEFLVITGDLYSLYKIPSDSQTTGAFIEFSLSGTRLSVTEINTIPYYVQYFTVIALYK